MEYHRKSFFSTRFSSFSISAYGMAIVLFESLKAKLVFTARRKRKRMFTFNCGVVDARLVLVDNWFLDAWLPSPFSYVNDDAASL